MIVSVKGNLLKSDCTIIMHQCNCFSKMGAGIAKDISNKWKSALEVDKNSPMTPDEKLGHFTYATENGITIVNLYGQYRHNRSMIQTNYDALENALGEFFKFLQSNPIDINPIKVGVPYGMGCGLAGGKWSIVLEILKRQSELYNIDIHTYAL